MRKCLFLLILSCPLILYGFRDSSYSLVISGARSTAVGGNFAIGALSIDGLYGNPALLALYTNSYFQYEFDAEQKFKGIRTDYRFKFDALSCFGLLITDPWRKGKPEYLQSPLLGVGFYALFRGSLAKSTTGVFDFSARKLGFSKSISLGQQLLLGVNVGPVFASEDNAFAISPSLQTGLVYMPSRYLSLGAYFMGPHYFNYSPLSSINVQESTPWLLSLGLNLEVLPGFRVMTEVNYQGWDSVTLVKEGKATKFQTGSGSLDLFQDVFFNLGFYLQSSGRAVVDTSVREANIRIQKLRQEIENLESDAALQALQEEKRSLVDRRTELINLSNGILYPRPTPEEERQNRIESERLTELRNELRESTNSEARSTLIFNSVEEKTKLQAKSFQLSNLIKKLEETYLARQKKILKEEDLRNLSEIGQALGTVFESLKTTAQKENEILDQKNSLLEAAKVKKKNQETLSVEEEKAIFTETLISQKKTEIGQLAKKAEAKPNLILPKGEFFLSFTPEVEYQADGSFVSMGNLSAGFSFRPFNLSGIYFNFSVTDKSLFRLIGLFPENDLNEVVKVSAEFQL